MALYENLINWELIGLPNIFHMRTYVAILGAVVFQFLCYVILRIFGRAWAETNIGFCSFSKQLGTQPKRKLLMESFLLTHRDNCRLSKGYTWRQP